MVRQRGAPCAVSFEGRTLRAFEDEPLAVALFAAGVRTLARSPKFHRPRGAFCFDGHCGSCLMRIDGNPSVPACMTPCRPGLRCEGQNAFPDTDLDVLRAADFLFPRGMDHQTLMTGSALANRWFVRLVRQMGGAGTLPDGAAGEAPPARSLRVDVAIVGAGPAGLTAADTLNQRLPARRVVLLDEQLEAGGSWRAEADRQLEGPARAARLGARGVLVLPRTTAIGYFGEDDARAITMTADAAAPEPDAWAELCAASSGAARDDANLRSGWEGLPKDLGRHRHDPENADPEAHAETDAVPGVLAAVSKRHGLIAISARRLLYATGAYDQNFPFPDFDKPGVISARACGRLAFGHGIRPGRRVAIVGASEAATRLADGLRTAGVEASAIRQHDPRLGAVLGVRGLGAMRSVITAPAGAPGNMEREPAFGVSEGTTHPEVVPADVVAVAATPAPATELPRQHGARVTFDLARGGFAVDVDGSYETGISRIYACGDVTGYVGPEPAANAGRAAALAIAHTLKRP